MAIYRSTQAIDYQRIPRPVAALAEEYESGFVHPTHSHERIQVIYASSGVMAVLTDQGSYIVPPQRAVWIPSRIEHGVHCRTSVSLRTLYVSPDARPELPTACRVFSVTNLLRELILEATTIPIQYDTNGRDGRIMELILDEIIATPTARLHVPMPQTQGLRKICNKIVDDPARNDLLDDLAKSSGCSRRTFTRLFRKETGMSFRAWRQHVRLLEATSRMAAGEPIARVAFDVGYNSQSAFSAMFHRTFGTTPSEYLHKR